MSHNTLPAGHENFPTYYELLGVKRNADDKTIRSAHYARIRISHDDMNQQAQDGTAPARDRETETRFLNAAATCLRDSDARRSYDNFLSGLVSRFEMTSYGSSYQDTAGQFAAPGWQEKRKQDNVTYKKKEPKQAPGYKPPHYEPPGSEDDPWSPENLKKVTEKRILKTGLKIGDTTYYITVSQQTMTGAALLGIQAEGPGDPENIHLRIIDRLLQLLDPINNTTGIARSEETQKPQGLYCERIFFNGRPHTGQNPAQDRQRLSMLVRAVEEEMENSYCMAASKAHALHILNKKPPKWMERTENGTAMYITTVESEPQARIKTLRNALRTLGVKTEERTIRPGNERVVSVSGDNIETFYHSIRLQCLELMLKECDKSGLVWAQSGINPGNGNPLIKTFSLSLRSLPETAPERNRINMGLEAAGVKYLHIGNMMYVTENGSVELLEAALHIHEQGCPIVKQREPEVKGGPGRAR